MAKTKRPPKSTTNGHAPDLSHIPGQAIDGHEFTIVPIGDVYEDPANARLHGPENLSAIEGSLRHFGQVEPLVIQKSTGKVIGGNGRLTVMKRLGWTEVKVIKVDIDKPDVANKDWSDTYHEQDIDGDGEEFYRGFMKAGLEIAVHDTAAWYCWHASKRQAMLEGVWTGLGILTHQQIIWAKSRPVLTYSAYMWAHEPCLMGWKKGNKPSIKRDYIAGEWPRSVWEIPNSEVESKDHPTSKPLRIFAIPIEMHTKKGEICYEPFSGSGSQLIAAEQLGRLCYGIEIAPQYVAVALERLAGLGLEPRLAVSR